MKEIKSASIDLTYKCNFRCKHCYNTSGEHETNLCELTDREVIRVAKDLLLLEPESVCLCGGEALLRKDLLFETCKILKSGDVKVSTVSNGFLLDDATADKLKECQIDLVQISIDGATSATHDWMRNKEGSFVLAINALKLLHERGIRTETAFVPTKRNIHELANAIDNAYELGTEAFRIQPIMRLGRAKKYLEDSFLSYEEYMKCKMLLDKKQKEYVGRNFIIEWADPIEHLRCYSNWKNVSTHITISAYGDILISPYISIAFGNIKRHSVNEYIAGGLKKVWGNPIIEKIVSKIHSADDMDVSSSGLPEIFVDHNIDLDILREDYETKTIALLKKWRDYNE